MLQQKEIVKAICEDNTLELRRVLQDMDPQIRHNFLNEFWVENTQTLYVSCFFSDVFCHKNTVCHKILNIFCTKITSRLHLSVAHEIGSCRLLLSYGANPNGF